MELTALQKTLRADHAPSIDALGEYRGAICARGYGDVDGEFEALLHGCGIYDLGFRSKISIRGNDRVRWLNGMVSNNIKELRSGQGVYAFVLNPQGRILGDLYAYSTGDSIVIDTDASQIEKLFAVFKRYIIMDKVELRDLGDDLTAVGVRGPKTQEILRKAAIEMPQLSPLQFVTQSCDCDCGCLQCTLVRGDDASGDTYEIWIEAAKVKPLWDALHAAGATPVGSDALEKCRIVFGTPLYGVDIRERELPQETGQMRALNFQKGCYIGQEIVERIRSRGNVHRKFAGFVSEENVPVAVGDVVSLEGKEVGEITSVASLRGQGREHAVALGYIRREIGSAGRAVTIGGRKAVISDFPLTASVAPREAVAANR